MLVQASEGIIAKRRIPALDGWRGIAIALVLFDHIQWALLHRYARPWTQVGLHGVTIFFVLSGFLITSKLIEQSPVLSQFYLRRFFRLMPAAWAYLAFVMIFNVLLKGHFTSSAEILSCIFFYRNFFDRSGLAVHFWSLSVEEQFYLVWPLLIRFGSPRARLWIAAIGAICCSAFRSINWHKYDHGLAVNQTQVRADALLVGCILALLLDKPIVRSWISQRSKVFAIPALAVLLFCTATFHWLAPLSESVAIAVLLAACVLHPASIGSRFLSLPLIAWLGTVSYSVYIWQEFFTYLPWPREYQPALFLVGLPLVTLFSYYCIERPATRLGQRLTRANSNA